MHIELSDLIGAHEFTGFDYTTGGCLFRLDGVIYQAEEDPDDGYRSYMRDLVIWDGAIKNEFQCSVVGKIENRGEILELIDTVTGKTVLEVGTDESDSYYPYYLSDFVPENMAKNL